MALWKVEKNLITITHNCIQNFKIPRLTLKMLIKMTFKVIQLVVSIGKMAIFTFW